MSSVYAKHCGFIFGTSETGFVNFVGVKRNTFSFCLERGIPKFHGKKLVVRRFALEPALSDERNMELILPRGLFTA